MKIQFGKHKMLVASLEVLQKINSKGYEAYIVGGAVRDMLLGKIPKDIDIATNFPITDLECLFKCHDIGKSKDFGIVTIEHKEFHFEVAQFRQEEGYADGRHPDKVVAVGSFVQDASRRDFTINAMAVDCDGNVLDHFRGEGDLAQGIIRTVGLPESRFKEDPLRIIRAVRFTVCLNMNLEYYTQKSIENNGHLIRRISKERIRDELCKMAEAGKLASGIEYFDAFGILDYIIPEIKALKAIDQYDKIRDCHFEGSVFNHSMLVTSRSPAGVIPQFAGLLHDIGKLITREVSPEGKIQFIGHEKVGLKITDNILNNLKLSRKMIEEVKILIRHHMRFQMGVHNTTPKAIRKLIRKIGEERINPLLDLIKADTQGTMRSGWISIEDPTPDLREKIEEVLNSPVKIKRKPALSGNVIMNILGIKPGPAVGEIKRALLDYEDSLAEEGKEITENIAMEFIKNEYRR